MRLIPTAYLASYFLSTLGNSIAAIALPLIVLLTTGSALGAGTVAAATALPAVVAGLLMGVVIDRINRRTSSVVTDLVSAAAMAALPIVDAITGLTIGWFVLFGILGSIGDVPGITAREALLPAIVRHGAMSAERLIGLREMLGSVAFLIGPALAGLLVTLLDGSTVLWVTAGTSFLAAMVTLAMPHRIGRISADVPVATAGAPGTPTPTPTPTRSPWRDLSEGWRTLARDRFLVTVTVFSVIVAMVLAAYQGLILPVYVTIQDQAGMLGLILSALAGGILLGAGLFAAVGTPGHRRAWFMGGLLLATAGFFAMASLPSVLIVIGAAALVGAGGGILNTIIGVVLIERIPESMRGRILSTQNAALTVAAPAGIMAAALLVEYATLEIASWSIASLWLIALAVSLVSRSLRSLNSSTPPADEDPTDAQQ
ncbi:MFS transporter [Microcella alkaliphila]|uniref:MFS transporter n=2 Tax=Microcella TaxID=337004 RepID=A0A4Q7LY26_9MICO|nr:MULTISPECIES: MFS transporter [Microcella]RZS59694.1 MFS transporter [Microcella putealis]RZT62212.1 MFS transporter [Microcella alkaliphila]TQM26807.1 MFS transporter [Microcella putealis]